MSVMINSNNLRRATERLSRELTRITEDPIPGIDLRPNEDNILEWHFVIHGKEDTPYYGGMYHGKLIFPSNFPFDPPKIIFLTPNGRFKTNERICFSLSDFHPEEWKPAFSVTTVLQGVTDLMHDSTETLGSIETSESVKRQLAENSSIHNGKDAIFCHLFLKLCGRKVTDSEDSSSEFSTTSPVREKTTSPDEITLPPRTQSTTSTEVTLPPTLLTPVPSKITPPSPPGETAMSEETILTTKETVFSIGESSSPHELIQTFERESLIPTIQPSIPSIKNIQEQRTITPQTHITPSVTRPILYPIRYPGPQPSSRGVGLRLQNVSQDVYQGFTIPLTYPTPKNINTNSQISANIGSEELHIHKETPSLPKEKIHRQIPSPEKKISPDVETFPVGNKNIQKQRNIAPPPHSTPLITKTIHDPVKHDRTRHSKRKIRIPAQNVSQKPFIRSPIYPKQQSFGKKSQTLENIELEEPIRYRGATRSQRNLAYLPKEIISRQTHIPESEICPDIERAYPSIGVITPVGRESLDPQEADVNSLRLHKFQRNTKRIHFTISALVVILLLILVLLLIALIFTLTQIDFNQEMDDSN